MKEIKMVRYMATDCEAKMCQGLYKIWLIAKEIKSQEGAEITDLCELLMKMCCPPMLDKED